VAIANTMPRTTIIKAYTPHTNFIRADLKGKKTNTGNEVVFNIILYLVNDD
jgi:hypothetical protein